MADWVYIAGRGHSGSTMLDAMLGNAPTIESVGELVSGMGRYDELCSCGEPFGSCPYWTAVRERFQRRTGLSWDQAVDRSKRQAHITAFPRTVMGGDEHEWVRELVAITAGIGDAIAAAGPQGTEPQLIVDSSKEITRALFFLRFVPSSRVIHLMRHPVSILQSDYYRLKGGTGFKFLRRRYHPKRFFGPFLALSVMTWIIGNLLADLTRTFARERFLRVRYEQLIFEPQETLTRIESFLECSLEVVRDGVRAAQPFAVGHNIGGNHMRLSGTFVFDPGKSRRKGLPVRYAIMSWLMTWPLLIAYGYRGRMIP